MIAALALAVATAPSRVTELPDLRSDRVSIQAVVRLPALDPLGRAAADLLARMVTGDNERYSRIEMRQLAAPGFEPRAHAMVDHLAIRVSVYPADVGAGVRMVAAMASSARLNEEEFARALRSERSLVRPAWQRALDPERRQWDLVRRMDVMDLYRLAFRPENVTVAVGGALKPGTASPAWQEAVAEWRPPRARNLRVGVRGVDEPAADGPSVIDLHGKEWSPSAPDFPERLVALVALGSGKGSSLFRVLRLERGMSYRQEAALSPSLAGLRPRLLVGIQGAQAGAGEEIRAALLKDVEAWSDTTLRRAVGYAAADVFRGMDLNPWHVTPAGAAGASLEDRTLLAAYWESKTGRAWDNGELIESIEAVTLEQAKAVALQFLKAAEASVHRSG